MLQFVHHVQLAMPAGAETQARAFYTQALGMTEIAKPAALEGRGGCWFAAGDVELHLGVDDPFVPAHKAHPAFAVADLSSVCAHLRAHGISYRPDVDLPRFSRVFVSDPFGNRIELLQVK